MLRKPRILFLFLSSVINKIKHEHSCQILYVFLVKVGVPTPCVANAECPSNAMCEEGLCTCNSGYTADSYLCTGRYCSASQE